MSQEDVNASMQPVNYQILNPRDDEISLYELWDVLVRRKIIVLAVSLLVAIAATVYVLTKSPIYQATATVEIGQIGLPNGRYSYLEKPQDIAFRMNRKLGVQVTVGKSHRKQTIAFLSLTRTANKPEATIEPIKKVIDIILSRHAQIYEKLSIHSSGYEQAIETQLKAIDDQEAQIQKIKKHTKNENMLLLLSEERKLQTRKVQLQKAIFQLELATDNTLTSVMAAPVIPTKPIKSRKKLVITLGVVLGLFLGVMAAFVWEFFTQARLRQQS